MRNFLLYLLACLFSVPASAADIPFFLPYPKIDTGRWQISNGWSNGSYMSCEWRADAVTVHDDNLLLTLSDRGESGHRVVQVNDVDMVFATG